MGGRGFITVGWEDVQLVVYVLAVFDPHAAHVAEEGTDLLEWVGGWVVG